MAKVNPPPDLEECQSYEDYSKQLEVWELTTSCTAARMGAMVADSLSNKSRFKPGLKSKFFEGVDVKELAGEKVWNWSRNFFPRS